jgi:hypothetical protein
MDKNWNASNCGSEAGLKAPVRPGCASLRRAVRGNMVSFPSQIPILLQQPPPDTQWRMVLLFFVCGWSAARIAARFHVPKHRIKKSLSDWASRGLALGYLQIIHPQAFAVCCGVDVEYGPPRNTEEVRVTGAGPAVGTASGKRRGEERAFHAVA